MSAASSNAAPSNAASPAPLEETAGHRGRTLITPEGIAVPIVVASRSARIGALILDLTFLILAAIALQLILAWLLGGLFAEVQNSASEEIRSALEFLFVFYVLMLFAARYGYFLWLELGPRGATLGKRAVGIRVAARNGARLTPEMVIARNLLRDIEMVLPIAFLAAAPEGEMGRFGLAGLVWFLTFMSIPFFNKDALRAGDIIAGTWVVEAPRTSLAQTLSTSGAANNAGSSEVTGARYQFGEAELGIYGERELQTLERILRSGNDEALSAVHTAICRKIGWEPGAGDERAFLEAFYAQLRARLESDMRFGKRKADKHS